MGVATCLGAQTDAFVLSEANLALRAPYLPTETLTTAIPETLVC